MRRIYILAIPFMMKTRTGFLGATSRCVKAVNATPISLDGRQRR